VLSSKWNSIASISLRLDALILCLLLGGTACYALARQSGAQLRTVHGTVVNSSGAPVSDAVVYLKNMRTLSVRTYISPHSGQYRFSGLDPNVDYQIHAEHQNLTSASHTISSFDSNPDIIIQLKIDRKKSPG